MIDFRKSTVYQIYPKSFKDTKGDGIGDLRGVIEKLDYLKFLGIDYIWLTPFYPSPQRDNGYDVSDYRSIDPSYGTMEDFQKLIEEGRERGIGIILDLVFNHTSIEHHWFQEALKGNKEYKKYYIFRKPKNGEAPSNWESKFGGSAWEYVPELKEYYLHLFDVTQADLNWDNPKVREELYDIVRFWMDKGVKGFRFDVINLVSKPQELKDDLEGDGRIFYTDGPKIHSFLKELNRKSYGSEEGIITMGEMSSTSLESCIKYTNPEERELSMVFNFHHLKVDYKDGDKWTLMPFDFMKLKEILIHWQKGMEEGQGWSALFWNNHDQPRANSRFGDDKEYLVESSKMLATAMNLLRGTPFIYQGEEFAMTNPYYSKIEDYRDVESINYYNILLEEGKSPEEIIEILKNKSRDNSRTPMQWNGEKNGGFTDGIPWIEPSENYRWINAEEALKDEESVLYHYKRLIGLRKELDVVAYGSFNPILKEHPSIFAYLREYKGNKLLVINNFYKENLTVELGGILDEELFEGEALLSNYKSSPKLTKAMKLRAYESLVYYLEKK